jgi:hypothetical protein
MSCASWTTVEHKTPESNKPAMWEFLRTAHEEEMTQLREERECLAQELSLFGELDRRDLALPPRAKVQRTGFQEHIHDLLERCYERQGRCAKTHKHCKESLHHLKKRRNT